MTCNRISSLLFRQFKSAELPTKKFQLFYLIKDEIGSETPQMQSSPGKCGMVIQLGTESRRITDITISITSKSHQLGKSYPNTHHHYPLYQM
jgi:hypothetical protein